jgi:hypothetical protein
MNRPPCGDEEDLIRGITSAHYQQGDISGKFFAGKAVSVNRLCRTELAAALEIFQRTLSNPDKGVSLEGYATFKHLPLKEETLKYVSQNKDIERDFHVVVEQDDSIPDNPGHAASS